MSTIATNPVVVAKNEQISAKRKSEALENDSSQPLADQKRVKEQSTNPLVGSEKQFTLAELVEFIENDLHQDSVTPLYKKESLKHALENYSGDLEELSRFAFFDADKKYTRNLIATDNKHYTLMLLCWNKGKFSPIHDHPCDGCWMKSIQGTVQEHRYHKEGSKLVETSTTKMSSGVLYIDDSLGLHKVGNPSDSVDAMTLHLYSPPFDKCKLWFDESNADKASVGVSCFYSEFGEKVEI